MQLKALHLYSHYKSSTELTAKKKQVNTYEWFSEVSYCDFQCKEAFRYQIIADLYSPCEFSSNMEYKARRQLIPKRHGYSCDG